MHPRSYYIINGITIYRMMAAPFLFFLIIVHRPQVFKWFLLFSFFTDAIDGFLARRSKVVSILGSRLDSIGDDLTVAAAIVGMIVFKPDFFNRALYFMIPLFALYLLQTVLAIVRYGKISSFHTYAAKTAAVLQGVFLLLLFFLTEPVYILFYLTIIVTAVDLIEEIILVLMIPKWETDVKGLYWKIREKQ